VIVLCKLKEDGPTKKQKVLVEDKDWDMKNGRLVPTTARGRRQADDFKSQGMWPLTTDKYVIHGPGFSLPLDTASKITELSDKNQELSFERQETFIELQKLKSRIFGLQTAIGELNRNKSDMRANRALEWVTYIDETFVSLRLQSEEVEKYLSEDVNPDMKHSMDELQNEMDDVDLKLTNSGVLSKLDVKLRSLGKSKLDKEAKVLLDQYLDIVGS